MASIQTYQEAVSQIKSGMSVMLGGFLDVGAPLKIIERLSKSGIKDLTIIQTVASFPGGSNNIGKLIKNRQIKKLICSHIGSNTDILKQYKEGTLEIEINPIKTLIERIRATGVGLGAIVTENGLETEIEEGRATITIDNKDYLLYQPLKADIAIIKGYRADRAGNIQYKHSLKGANPIMAAAADIVLAEVEEVVEVGKIPYESVGTPGSLVDIIIENNIFHQKEKCFKEYYANVHNL